MSDETASVFGPYWSGQEKLYGDPTEIYRTLLAETGGQLNHYCDLAQKDDANEALPAVEVLVNAARAAFRLVPFDPQTGKGCTELMACDCLRKFFNFLSAEKKSGGRMPTSPEPTEPATSAVP